MDRWTAPAIYLVILLAFGVIFGGCGTYVDTTPPTSTLTDPPSYIFMNGPGETVTFRGTASDDTVGIEVEISFDNKANWTTAADEPLHSRFDWSYAATAGELPSTSSIWTRATDNDGNAEDPQLWSTAAVDVSTTLASFESFYANAGTVLYLSSGSGGAYGTSSSAGPVLANSKDLMVVGSGYGTALTADGFSAVDATPQTALATSSGSSYIFSVGPDLTLKNLRIIGGTKGVFLADNGPLKLELDDCLLEKQKGWGIYADDTNGTGDDVQVTISGVMIDASSATATNHGGVFLDNTVFDVSDSLVKGQQPPSGFGAGLYAAGGSGSITGGVFEKNGLAIWATDGSPVIASCNITGMINTTSAGVNLSGGPGDPEIRNNHIRDNTGYGLRIGGVMTPRVRNNVIENNQGAGIVIDFTGSVADLNNIDLGTTTDWGNNDLFDNHHPDPAAFTGVQIFVSSNTPYSALYKIPADWNFWGSTVTTKSVVLDNIIDGRDYGNSRAWIELGTNNIKPGP